MEAAACGALLAGSAEPEELDGAVAAGFGFVGVSGTLSTGAGGRGAETPAMSEPSPSFCRLGASSLPVGSIPLADWNFWRAETVLASHLPVGSPV